MVKDENFIAIQGWMINKLKLKGNELLVYAIIYGFSQLKDCIYTGTSGYLADWCGGVDKRTIYNVLKSLIEKKLIIKIVKEINGVVFNYYKASDIIYDENFSLDEGAENFSGGRKNNTQEPIRGTENFSQGGGNFFRGGAENFSDINNIDNNINNNIKEKKEKFSGEGETTPTAQTTQNNNPSVCSEPKKPVANNTVNADSLPKQPQNKDFNQNQYKDSSKVKKTAPKDYYRDFSDLVSSKNPEKEAKEFKKMCEQDLNHTNTDTHNEDYPDYEPTLFV